MSGDRQPIHIHAKNVNVNIVNGEGRPDSTIRRSTLERKAKGVRPVEADVAAKKESPRLPTNYEVETYRYRQTPNFEDLTFAGEETVVMTVTEPSRELVLNALDLDIQSARFKAEDGKIYPASVTYDKEEQRVTFGFGSELQGRGELDLSFAGDFKDAKGEANAVNGTYLAKWQDAEGKTHYWATSQYEPADARRALVLADEPDRKAVFEVTLITPKGWGAVSNMKRRGEVYEEDGHDVHIFNPTPKMSPYLLANIIGEFDIIEDNDRNKIQHRVITTPGKGEQGRMALEVSKEVLPFYEEWTGIPFPLDKQDNIAVPKFEAGAMENWGAITYREERLLVDPANSSQATKEDMVKVVGHEEAHMWFGNLVSPKWWTYLWLNESFATYMSYIASDHVHPEWNVWDSFMSKEQNLAFRVDSLKNTHPVEVEVNYPNEVDEIFDAISYQKGASILNMLSHFITPDNFRLGTSDYLRQHAHGSATTQDLLQAYEERSGLPIREVMNNWLYQPGHPVIVVKDEGDHLELTQERFFISERSRKEGNDTTVWQIPLLVHEEGQDSNPLLMRDKALSISRQGNGNWFLINEGGSSFVRVDYPESVLQSLREPIAEQRIAPADRFALVRDAFDLAQGGISSVDKALSFVEAFRGETNFSVWSVVAEKLGNVANILDGEAPEVQLRFNAFTQSLFKPVVERLGWEKKPGESNKDTLLRELAIGSLGKYGDEETILIAHEKFEAHVSGQTPLDPDLRNAVYKIVAANGTEKEYEEMMDLYKNSTVQEERGRILLALGGFNDSHLTERSLHFALFGEGNEDAPQADAYKLMASLFGNPHARERAWEFTKEHWDRILEVYGETQLFLPRFINPAGQFYSIDHARDVEEFFSTHQHPGAERTVHQVVEIITSKADWLERDRNAIVNFLGNYVKERRAA